VTPFYELLYKAAERLRDDAPQDEFSFAGAILIAGTAAETAVNVVITEVINRKGLGPVAVAANEAIRSHNLKDRKDRGIWRSITGDDIANQPFWNRYTAHVDRRNDVAHTGKLKDGQPVSKTNATASLKVVRELLDHITAVLQATK